MAPLRKMQFLVLAVVLGTVVATEEEWNQLYHNASDDSAAREADDPVAREAKMGAVKKVLGMLEDLRSQVMQEGEEEVATYNKFSCFCKDTMQDKGDAVSEGTTAQSTLMASVGTLETARTDLDTTIDGLVSDIEGLEQDVTTLKDARKVEAKQYQENNADLTGAVEALGGAIQKLKSSKTPSLAQWQAVAKTVRVATVMAEALGLASIKAMKSAGAAFFLQATPVIDTSAAKDYSFHSNSIIETLEGLLTDFKGQKNDVDAAEVTAKHAYDTRLQELKDNIATKNRELDTAKKNHAKKMEEISSTNQDLSTVSATLLDDKAYLMELGTMCSNKAKTWDSRSAVRADELSAITAAIGIIEDKVSNSTSSKTIRFAQRAVHVWPAEAYIDGDMEFVEAGAEVAAEQAEAKVSLPSFFQQRSVSLRGVRGQHDDDGRKTVINLLRSEGKHLQSTMLTSLASQIAEDPFAKVKTLITELIERLLQQASNEATQKGWCDKSMSDASQKRDFAAEEIRELNDNMAELEALRDRLAEEITVLGSEVQALEKKQTDADNDRAAEKTENTATIAEAKVGKEAVEEAVQLLDRFYKTAANQKGKVDLSLIQRGPASDDAPDAGFDEAEAYGGAQGAAEGVLGLLEVIRSDFIRTKTETEKAEAQAEQDHLDFTTKTQSSIAAKNVAKGEKETQKQDADGKFTEAEDNLGSQTDLLKGAIQELMQLHDTCVDTAMSYEERLDRRNEEIAALKKAECILTAYAQFGPDAAVSADC